jgi:hypothetical protein
MATAVNSYKPIPFPRPEEFFYAIFSKKGIDTAAENDIMPLIHSKHI